MTDPKDVDAIGSALRYFECVPDSTLPADGYGRTVAAAYRAQRQRIEELEAEAKTIGTEEACYCGCNAHQWKSRADKAQSEAAALREALEKIANEGGPDFDADDMAACASKALAPHPSKEKA